MKKLIATLVIVVLIATCQIALSNEVRALGWKDLVPSDLSADDLFNGLNEEQRSTVSWSINWFNNLPERNSETEEIFEIYEKTIAELEEAGIDINEIIKKQKKLHTSVVKELNGQKVSIPGYLLPLEMTGSSVTEFLLVPYIGACILAPPPRPNQIVHVTIDGKKGYKSKTLFDPVLVTGVILIESLVKDLYLVDGSSNISIGYIMKATKIKSYK